MEKLNINDLLIKLEKTHIGNTRFFKIIYNQFESKIKNNIKSIISTGVTLIDNNIIDFKIIDEFGNLFFKFDGDIELGENYKEILKPFKNKFDISFELVYENKDSFSYIPYIEDDFIISNVILSSAAGFYLGSISFTEGYMEPSTRESKYFLSKEEVILCYPLSISTENAYTIAKKKNWIE